VNAIGACAGTGHLEQLVFAGGDTDEAQPHQSAGDGAQRWVRLADVGHIGDGELGPAHFTGARQRLLDGLPLALGAISRGEKLGGGAEGPAGGGPGRFGAIGRALSEGLG